MFINLKSEKAKPILKGILLCSVRRKVELAVPPFYQTQITFG